MFLSKLRSCHFTLMHDKYKLRHVLPMNLFIPSDLRHYQWSNIRLHIKIRYLSRRMVPSDQIFKAVTSCRAKLWWIQTSTHSFRWLLSSSLRSNQRISLHEEMYYISDEIILAWYNISICNRHGETLWIILRCLFRRLSIRGLSKRSSGGLIDKRLQEEGGGGTGTDYTSLSLNFHRGWYDTRHV